MTTCGARSEIEADRIRGRIGEFRDCFLLTLVAAERGYIDDVIMPHSPRRRIARGAGDAARQEGGNAGEEA